MNRRIKKKLNRRFRIRQYSRYKQLMKMTKSIRSQISKPSSLCDFYNNLEANKPIRVKFDGGDYLTKLCTREPTEIECRKFLINRLRTLYRLAPSMHSSQYRSVKGQIRRGYIEYGINFMANHAETYNDSLLSSHYSREYLYESLDRYKNSDLHEMIVTYSLTMPVRCESVDIQLGKLNLEDGNDTHEI